MDPSTTAKESAASAVVASRRTRHLFSQDIDLSRLVRQLEEDETINDNEGSGDIIISSGGNSRRGSALSELSTDNNMNDNASSVTTTSSNRSSQSRGDNTDVISNIGESNHSIGLDKHNSLHSLSEHGDVDEDDNDVPSPSPPSTVGARSSGAFALALEGLDDLNNVHVGDNNATRRGNNRQHYHASSRFTVASANNRHELLSAVTTTSFQQRGNDTLLDDFDEELLQQVDDSNRSNNNGISVGIIGGNKKEGLLVYPEVDMLLKELDRRVVTLEDMVKKKKKKKKSSYSGSSDDKPALLDGGSPSTGSRGISVMNELMPSQDNNNNNNNNNNSTTMTKEQQNAIEGLSSNIRGLIHCLNHRHQEQQDEILVALHDSDDEGDAHTSGGLGMAGSFSSRNEDDDNDSLARIKRIAKTKSRKELLNDILGREKEVGGGVVPTEPMTTTTTTGMTSGKWDNLMGGIIGNGGGGKKKKNKKLNALVRATVFSSNTGMRSLGECIYIYICYFYDGKQKQKGCRILGCTRGCIVYYCTIAPDCTIVCLILYVKSSQIIQAWQNLFPHHPLSSSQSLFL